MWFGKEEKKEEKEETTEKKEEEIMNDTDSLFEMMRDRFSNIEMNQARLLQKLDTIEGTISKLCERVAGTEHEVTNIKIHVRKISSYISLIVSAVISATFGWVSHLLGRP